MTREEIIAAHPLKAFMEGRGHAFRQAGKEWACVCPFHADKSPSLRVNMDKGTWFCDPCGFGGSVIDLVMRLDSLDTRGAMEKLGGTNGALPPPPAVKPKPVCKYVYADANGKELFQVVRFEPKTFRQRHLAPDGKTWIWNMERVSRVLYRLPEVNESPLVAIVEGEKDADTLAVLGQPATCNVGGAGKWLDAYTESLTGKDVILCGDNDKPGREHMDLIASSLAGKVKSLRRVEIPDGRKDVSDWLATFPTPEEKSKQWLSLVSRAKKIHGGIDLPLFTMEEMEQEYRTLVSAEHKNTFDMGDWLPSLRGRLRKLFPGELVGIVADVSMGKTAVMQSIIMAAHPLPTLLFEMELPNTLSFERFVMMQTKRHGHYIEDTYRAGGVVDWRTDSKINHVLTCPLSKMTIELMESLILKSPLKLGVKPLIVMVDYMQLVRGKGQSRYEKTSEICEDLKALAKSTGTIIFFGSQISRKKDEAGAEVFLHDGKDSGSIEASSGVILGVWRDKDDEAKMFVKVCKQTKGPRNFVIPCNFHGETLTITERRESAHATS